MRMRELRLVAGCNGVCETRENLCQAATERLCQGARGLDVVQAPSEGEPGFAGFAPGWANLASLDSVISAYCLVPRRIARCRRPLYIARTEMADLLEIRNIRYGRRMEALCLCSPRADRIESACRMGTRASFDRFYLGLTKANQPTQ